MKNKREKPTKPYAAFPLTPHPRGVWCKKIKGTVFYFGRWEDPDGALADYLRKKDYLQAGLDVPEDVSDCTVGNGLNRFLDAKNQLVQIGELSQRSFRDYRDCIGRICHTGRQETASRRMRAG